MSDQVETFTEILVLINSFFQGLSRASMFIASGNKHVLDDTIKNYTREFHKINLIQLRIIEQHDSYDTTVDKAEKLEQLKTRYSQFFNQLQFTLLSSSCTIGDLLDSFDNPLGALVKLDAVYNENKRYIYMSIMAAMMFNCLALIITYVARSVIINYFTFSTTSEDQSLTEKLLLINGIGLIPDSVRIVSSSILRGWGNIMLPNIVSLVCMSVIGIPLGSLLGLVTAEKSIVPIFIVRSTAILVAATANCYFIVRQFRSEHYASYQRCRLALAPAE